MRGVLGILSGVIFLTALLTLMIPETKGKTLEEIESGVIYGRAVTCLPSTNELPVVHKSSTAGSFSEGDVLDLKPHTPERIQYQEVV